MAALLVAACSKLDLLDLTVPRYGYIPKLDMAYGAHPRQTLDIYLPEKQGVMPRPVVVFFYGGGWRKGTKEDYRFVGESLANQGYVTVVANYRLYPEVKFPRFVEDAALAVRWVRGNIAQYGGDANNLYVAGHSAGAYNAVMLAVDPRYLRAVGGTPSWIRGAIGLSGPYDFLPVEDPNIADIFSTAPANVTQPVYRVNGAPLPPMLLINGADDVVVSPQNSKRMARALERKRVRVITHIYEGVNHPGVAQAMASSFTFKAPVIADITAFIEETRR